MRYFLISYVGTHPKGHAFGQVNFESMRFPSHIQIKEMIPHSIIDVTILNIFEFKSEKDFAQFRKEL